ncbi:MAG TPA: SDR family NAD(P)-dependent oxidoreductase [Mycobacteriales bacterium]|nr:SDR family NAD(P)-dependent oxidoreductase [Mycobacteriales bacterium]
MTEQQSAGSFAGQVAWITGGANGFGAGAARRLAGLGASIVISDVDRSGGAAVAAEVGGTFVPCDVTSYDDNRAAVDAVLERHGRLDIAFLNAGISTGIGIGADFDLERYRRAMAVNLDGVVFGMQRAVTAMADHGGAIVATASLAGLTATPFDPFYGANKHGVVGLVRAVGAAYAGTGIRVNAICPGFADTNIVSPEARETLQAIGVPLLSVERVVEAFLAALTSSESGQCWFIQPGRPIEPFRFRNLPGPRDESGAPASSHAGEVQRSLTERGAH